MIMAIIRYIKAFFSASISFILKFLWKLVVVNPEILSTSSQKEKGRFAILGMLFFIVIVITLFSGIYISKLFFYNSFFALIMGVFLGWNLFNIYRFILSNIQSKRLPHLKAKKSIWFAHFFILTYIVAIALFISKPIELFFTEQQLEELLEDYRAEKLESFRMENLNFIDKEIIAINNEVVKLDNSTLDPATSIERRRYLQNLKTEYEQKKKNYLQSFIALNKRSTYVLPRIRLMHQHFYYTWFIFLLILTVLLIPIILKYSFIENSLYEKKVDNQDYNLILSEYFSFKNEYKSAMQVHCTDEISFHENFIDPPFNTNPITDDRKKLGKTELLSKLEEHER